MLNRFAFRKVLKSTMANVTDVRNCNEQNYNLHLLMEHKLMLGLDGHLL